MGSFLRNTGTLAIFSAFVCLSVVTLSEESRENFDLTRQDILDVVKDEMQQMNKEVTEKLMLESGRRRRATAKNKFIDMDIFPVTNITLEATANSEVFAFECDGKYFVIKENGIYIMDGLPVNATLGNDNATVVRINDFVLKPGDSILDSVSSGSLCFVLVATKNNTFTSLYTLHGEAMKPVLRQEIKNYGFVVTAKFFKVEKKLYLIIINDNAVHSLTICPLFRWARTYMDEIHAIQTRGATAVTTFRINAKTYIAIAQSQDSNGNYEVGTVILTFDFFEQLEKLQVLWSYHPVSLDNFKMNGHYYLVIGMAKESSIVYFFGGINFIYWDSLEDVMGENIFFRSIFVSDRDPVLLIATSSSIKIYTKSLLPTLITVKVDVSQQLLQPYEKLDDIFLIKNRESHYYIAVVKSRPGTRYCSIFYLQIHSRDLEDIKETTSKLAQCLTDLRSKLNEEVGIVKEYQNQLHSILTVDKKANFSGTIISESQIIVNPKITQIAETKVAQTSNNGYNSDSLPVKILKSIYNSSKVLHDDVLNRLDDAVYKSQPRNITGNLAFQNLSASYLYGYSTYLKFDTINGREWQEFEEHAFFANHSEQQIISGRWVINSLMTNSVDISKLAGINSNAFVLKNCPEDRIQVIQGSVKFETDALLEGNVKISPKSGINGISFDNIVMKKNIVTEVRGFKHTQNLYGGDEFVFSSINGKNYIEWYATVAHIAGSPQRIAGHIVIDGAHPNIFHQLSLLSVNLVEWNYFIDTALFNGKDQFIGGDLILQEGILDAVVVDSIEAFHFSDLLNVPGNQDIHRNLTADVIEFKKSIQTHTVNGRVTSAVVVLKDEDTIITGSVSLSYCVVNASIVVPSGVTIGGKDISELAKSRIKHIYYSYKDSDIFLFKANVEANNLKTNNINDYSWETLKSGVWSKNNNNIIAGPLELRGKKVHVGNFFHTRTLNSIDLKEDIIQLQNPDVINSKIFFADDVYVSGNIYHSAGKYIGGVNIANSISGIVRKNHDSVITGKKYFVGNIFADAGIATRKLNEIDVLKDVLFLNGLEEGDLQTLQAPKHFKSTIQLTDVTTYGSINVNGTVFGYSLSDLLINSVTKTDLEAGDVYLKGNLHFNNSLYVHELVVRSYLNGIDISDYLKKIIFLNKPTEIHFPIILYGGNVDFQTQATVTNINEINVVDFLSKIVLISGDHDYQINGTKTFKDVLFDTVQCEKFNGINLSEMGGSSLMRSEPQQVAGPLYFSSLRVEGNGFKTQEIGGIPVDLFITTGVDDPCEVYFDVKFTGDSVKIEKDLTLKSLNSYLVEEISSGYKKGLGNRTFHSIEVEGNIQWRFASHHAENNLGVLSKLLDKAVTLDKSQIITGKVEFLDGVSVGSISTEQWINNIDFSKLLTDSVHPDKTDEATLNFNGKNVFDTLHVKKYASIETLEVTTVNEVNLQKLDQMAVRKTSTKNVFGTKTFVNELSVQNLTFYDFLNYGDLTDLVTIYDNRTVDLVEFEDIQISGNLNFTYSEQLDLQNILKNRVSKTKEQVLHGNYTFSSLMVNGSCYPTSINSIPVNDIYLNKAGQPSQHISGEKTFLNGVHVRGEMRTADVNGYNFAALHSDVYRRNEPEKLNRPIVFMHPVIIDSKIKVEKKINNYDYHELSERFSKALKDVEIRATNYSSFGRSHFEKLQQLQHYMTAQKPFWFEFLRSVDANQAKLPKLESAVRIEQTETDSGVLLAFYSRTSSDNSLQLNYGPNECYCNTVQFLLFKQNSLLDAASHTITCANQFVVSTPSGNVYTVQDDGASYNKTCNIESLGPTRLTISSGTNTGMIIPGSEILSLASEGFLIDVDAFSSDGHDYIVLAFGYSDKKYYHSEGKIVIYEVSDGNGKKMQTLSGLSPNRIAISEVQYGWILSIAGSKKPSVLCNSTSSIYRWSPSKKQFEVLRSLKTEGAVDVTFLTVEDLSRNGKNLSFIAFAQQISGSEAGGEVHIYSYSSDFRNYELFQILRFQWSVSAVESTCIMEECYILVVVPQEGVHFFKYQYVEEFKLYLSVPVKDTYDLTPFVLHHRLFYGLAGFPWSFLAEGQIAGVDYFR